MALNLIRCPWEYDVLVMENIFGDILSDMGGGLVGGMGMQFHVQKLVINTDYSSQHTEVLQILWDKIKQTP